MADHGRLIDADALIADCQLAQKQADRHGREFANAFYSGGGEISTEWWCVEDMIENAPTIEPAHGTGYRDGYKRGKRAGYKKARNAGRKKGKWIRIYSRPNVLKYLGWTCSVCGTRTGEERAPQWFNYCPNCGARMEEGGAE